jgi:hypothetical protein
VFKVEDGEKKPTLADRAGDRPWWIFYDAKQIINYQETFINGRAVKQNVTIETVTHEPDGRFGEKEFKRPRVYTRGGIDEAGNQINARFEILVETEVNGRKEWTQESEGSLSTVEIPLVMIDDMSADPPLMALVMLNILHYNKTSDFDDWAHIACVPCGCISSPRATGIVARVFASGMMCFVRAPSSALPMSRQLRRRQGLLHQARRCQIRTTPTKPTIIWVRARWIRMHAASPRGRRLQMAAVSSWGTISFPLWRRRQLLPRQRRRGDPLPRPLTALLSRRFAAHRHAFAARAATDRQATHAWPHALRFGQRFSRRG